MDKKISQRIGEFRNIINAYSEKDSRGIVIIRASISRLFVDVLEMDCGQSESDAQIVWNKYLNELDQLKPAQPMATENGGGFLVSREYVMPICFKLAHPYKRIQEIKNRIGIRAWFLRLIGSEDGYIRAETPEYLEFKAEWEREHPTKAQD